MCEKKGEESQRDPAPAPLHKEDVKEIAFAGKVRRREGRVLGVSVAESIVGGVANSRREEGEQCAERQDNGIGE